jgi:hypothetical protein
MTVTPGLWSRRLTFYERRENGADGFARPVYVRTGEYWGRLDDTADSQEIPLDPQTHVESRTDATAHVADYVDVPKFGIIRDTTNAAATDQALYLIRGVYLQRALRQQRVTLETIDPTAYGLYVTYEDADVWDGYHLVTEN